MRIQYASDLHLELWKKKTYDETLEPVAPILALLGDVARLDAENLRLFLEYTSEKWELVFWIPGNEEIWNSGTEETSLKKMTQLCKPYNNIKVLYKNTFFYEDTLFAGLSLWHKPREGMIRYNNTIYIKPIPIPINENIFRKAHDENVEFLKYTLKHAEAPIVVLSYYPPFTWLYEQDYIQEPMYALIDGEVESLITYPIIAWLCGHNHLPIEYNRRYFLADGYQGNVLFVSNPRGKPKKDNDLYRREAVLRLQPNLLEGFQPKEEEPIPLWAKRQ